MVLTLHDFARFVGDLCVRDNSATDTRHNGLVEHSRPDDRMRRLEHDLALLLDLLAKSLQHLDLREWCFVISVDVSTTLRVVLRGMNLLVGADDLGGHQVDLRCFFQRVAAGQVVALPDRLDGTPRGLKAVDAHLAQVLTGDNVYPPPVVRPGLVQLKAFRLEMSRLDPHEVVADEHVPLVDVYAIGFVVLVEFCRREHVVLLVWRRGLHHEASVVLDGHVGGHPATDDGHHLLAPLTGPDQRGLPLEHQLAIPFHTVPEELEHLFLCEVVNGLEVEDRWCLLGLGYETVRASPI
mmetsp:Transcript_142903/g.398147  ORF Transcript_142903/g.398147 Transcript_142903/m.398147 type:complete len:295 (+) Transcript_142903:534-1418(+)